MAISFKPDPDDTSLMADALAESSYSVLCHAVKLTA